MNTRSLAGNTGEVVEPLGSGAFMEEVGHWGQALSASSLAPRPHFQFAFCFRLEDATVCLLLQPPCLPLAALPISCDGLTLLEPHPE